MTAAVALTPIAGAVMLPLEQLHESPTNPRKHFGDLAELVESVKQKGVLEPVKARPIENGYELVFGARRTRAARAAGLKEIPALLAEMSDKEVLEEQLIENMHREDVHPLEEADGYSALMKKHNYKVEQLAAKVGKSKAYIYGRLKLTALCEEGRKQFFDGTIDASKALLVARVPHEKLQLDVLKRIGKLDWQGQSLSFRLAEQIVQTEYMLRLSEAPFSTTDAQLVPAAGACSTCPKRTGNQRELFADVKSADVCTDPICHKGKVDALWQLTKKTAEDKGQKVLEGKAAEGVRDSYIELKEYAPGTNKTWAQALGKDKKKLEVAVVRQASGRVVEMVQRKDAEKLLPGANHEPSAAEEKDRAKYEAEKRKREQKERERAAVIVEVIKRVEKAEVKPAAWKVLAQAIADNHDLDDVYERRGWSAKLEGVFGDTKRDAVASIIEGLTIAQARGVVVECILAGDNSSGDRHSSVDDIAKSYGIDPKAALAAAEKARAALPRCLVPGCGEPAERAEFCIDHHDKLNEKERKSMVDRSKSGELAKVYGAPTKKKAKKK